MRIKISHNTEINLFIMMCLLTPALAFLGLLIAISYH